MKNDHREIKLSRGMEIDVEVSKLAYGGDGLAHYRGYDIYAPCCVPGSTVRVKLEEVKRDMAFGHVTKMIKESPEAVVAPCKHFGVCGGCDWMNIKFDKQKEAKTGFVKDMLKAEAGLGTSLVIKEMISYKDPYGYRHRAEYVPVHTKGGIGLGFFKARSHESVHVENCLIVHPKINELAGVIAGELSKHKKEVTVYGYFNPKGYLRHVAIKVNSKGDALVTFIVNAKEAKQYIKEVAEALGAKGVSGVTVNYNTSQETDLLGSKESVLFGKPYVVETSGSMEFRLDSGAFFQVNPFMLETMQAFVSRVIPEGASVVDLYGGLGALTLPSAQKFREIIIVDADERAINKAKGLIKIKGLKNVRAICAPAEEVFEDVLRKSDADVAVVDPPRKGLHPGVIAVLKGARLGRVVYISCNPQSFARDMQELKEIYKIKEVTPLDQFAQTYHVELMALLELKSDIQSPMSKG